MNKYLLEEDLNSNLNQKLYTGIITEYCGIKILKQQLSTSLEFIKPFADEKLLNKHLKYMGFYVYQFKIVYNKKEWTIKKLWSHLVQLDHDIRNHFKSMQIRSRIPQLKNHKDKTDYNGENYFEEFHQYLLNLLKIKELSDFEPFMQFLEFSSIQVSDYSQKYQEVYIRKRAGGRFKETSILFRLGAFLKCWDKRYLVITSDGVMYSKGHAQQDSFIRESLMFDHNFNFKFGRKNTGINYGIKLIYSNRRLYIQALNTFDFYNIINSLKEAINSSPLCRVNPYSSFAPVRNKTRCKWFIDGQNYFNDVYDKLENATHQIFITGWWISPELYLKRPIGQNQNSRLDRVLLRAANREVSIKIIVFCNNQFLPNDSAYVHNLLEKLHPNIKVLRHPINILPTFMWSHHEKMIVIDQSIAYLGGLDLCYGRYDTNDHYLHGDEQTYPGIDYSNVRSKDFVDVQNHTKCLVDRKQVPRMAWHDIAMRVEGESVQDFSRHFIQYWNFAKFDIDPTNKNSKETLVMNSKKLSFDQTQPDQIQQQNSMSTIQRLEKMFKFKFQNKNNYQSNYRQTSNLDNTFINQNFRSNKLNVYLNYLKNQYQTDLDKDQINEVDDIEELKMSMQRSPNLTKTLSSQSQLKQKSSIKSSKSMVNLNSESNKDFIELLEQLSKNEQQNEENYLQSQKIQQIPNSEKTTVQKLFNRIFKKVVNNYDEQLILNDSVVPFDQTDNNLCSCQMVRSASSWSLGLKQTEMSLQIAYLKLITDAKHFIYIENQFFISSHAGAPVVNEISKAIVKRIQKAHILQQQFKVIVFLPLLPGFEGEVDDQQSALIRNGMHWQYQTICRGGNSLLEELYKTIQNPFEYINFYGLRNHGLLENIPKTEIIYIHSKLLIIDDMIALIGSANINDRSQKGTRDSEIAVNKYLQRFILYQF